MFSPAAGSPDRTAPGSSDALPGDRRDDACVFCRIVAGEEPSSRVLEGDGLVAFMTRRPTRPGELLVIPREHIDHFCDVPDDLASEILIAAQRLARALRVELEPRRVGYVVHGFGVPHAHLVVVPMESEEDITSGRFAVVSDGRVEFRADAIDAWPRDELDSMAARIRASLGRPDRGDRDPRPGSSGSTASSPVARHRSPGPIDDDFHV